MAEHSPKISQKHAMNFYFDILKEVDVRVGRNPNRKRVFKKDMKAGIINECQRVLSQPEDYVNKYRLAKISSLLCSEFKNYGII